MPSCKRLPSRRRLPFSLLAHKPMSLRCGSKLFFYLGSWLLLLRLVAIFVGRGGGCRRRRSSVLWPLDRRGGLSAKKRDVLVDRDGGWLGWCGDDHGLFRFHLGQGGWLQVGRQGGSRRVDRVTRFHRVDVGTGKLWSGWGGRSGGWHLK